ncbi:hypothetical protein [Acidisoma sp. 7E03]
MGHRDILVLLAALAGCPPVSTAGAGQLPPEVTAYLVRQAACDHWAGEEPYDAARGSEIAAAIHRLHCDGLEADAARLRKRYRQDPAVLEALRAPEAP